MYDRYGVLLRNKGSLEGKPPLAQTGTDQGPSMLRRMKLSEFRSSCRDHRSKEEKAVFVMRKREQRTTDGRTVTMREEDSEGVAVAV